jgi:ABC-2 type transport system ATP-binding protein
LFQRIEPGKRFAGTADGIGKELKIAMNAIHLDNISFSYGGERPFLDNFHVTIPKGEIVTLAGLNGAGKTTLIRIAATLLAPQQGKRHYFENPALTMKQIRRRIGYAAQEIALYQEYTVEENLRLFAGLYGLKNRESQIRIDELASLLQLEDHLNVTIKNCSGGTRRKTHLAVSLLHEPELLILDEPTAGIDIKTAEVILKTLRTLARMDRAVLCAAHSLDEILTLSGRVLVMKNGRMVRELRLPDDSEPFSEMQRQEMKRSMILSL